MVDEIEVVISSICSEKFDIVGLEREREMGIESPNFFGYVSLKKVVC